MVLLFSFPVFRPRGTVSLDHPLGSIVLSKDGKSVEEEVVNNENADPAHGANNNNNNNKNTKAAAGNKFFGGGDGQKRMPTIFKYGGNAKEVYVCGNKRRRMFNNCHKLRVWGNQGPYKGLTLCS